MEFGFEVLVFEERRKPDGKQGRKQSTNSTSIRRRHQDWGVGEGISENIFQFLDSYELFEDILQKEIFGRYSSLKDFSDCSAEALSI